MTDASLLEGNWRGLEGPLGCAADSVFAQLPYGPDEAWNGVESDELAGEIHYENYQTAYGSAICSVKWLGFNRVFGSNWRECNRTPDRYNIVFYPNDSTGMPDTANPAFQYPGVTPVKEPTGLDYSNRAVYEYRIDLSTVGGCCTLDTGWISIEGVDDGHGCWMLWMTSGDGNGSSVVDYGNGLEMTYENLGICLGGDLPDGACCDNSSGSCVDNPPVAFADCRADGQRFMPGGVCADFDPPCGTVQGACCLADGCILTDAAACAAAGGNYIGDGTTCDEAPCCDCPNPISVPYCEGFEQGTGRYTQALDDDTDWQLQSGPSWSPNTGPDSDHTVGTDAGHYLFIPSIYYSSHLAVLNGPCVDLGSATIPAIRFWYHMYGRDMGTLTLEVSSDGCLTWVPVFTRSGDQGPGWKLGTASLTSYAGQVIHYRFTGYTGSTTSDIALDDICIFDIYDIGGACCLDGACTEYTSQSECVASGGAFQGNFTMCTPNPCMGACCQEESCTEETETDCSLLGGAYMGGRTTCDTTICPQPGNDCSNPLVVAVPGDLPYSLIGTTDGRGNEYQNTCHNYDTGEDIILELNVETTLCVNITLRSNEDFMGFAIFDLCPAYGNPSCLFTATGSANPDKLEEITLTPGTYYLMIDGLVSNAADIDFLIEECPTGACCLGDSCAVMTPLECEEAEGNYVADGTDCSNDPCHHGACCDNGVCTLETAETCAGIYRGDATACVPGACDGCGCPNTVVAPYCEDFEGGNLGLWTQSAEDDTDFTLTDEETPSDDTGPGGDHTTGSGWYIFTEASRHYNYVAIIDGPCVDLSALASPEAEFWYHMYGEDTGTVAFEVSATDCITWDRVWELSGDQGNAWRRAQVDLSAYIGQTVHLRFQVLIGDGTESDTALDDICIHEAITGACCVESAGCSEGSEMECAAAGGVYAGDESVCAADCNGNGETDICEIIFGAQDCQQNGLLDVCEIVAGTSTDLNGNGLPDDCDRDCNTNGVPDEIDILAGTSSDCQQDGLPDECQLTNLVTRRAYGQEASRDQAAYFDLDSPGAITYVGDTEPHSGNFLGAGDFGPEDSYAFMYVLESGSPHNLYTMSTATGELTVIGTAAPEGDESWVGMAWDATTQTMYASSTDTESSFLYTLNIRTGRATLVAEIDGSPQNIALAADCDGVLYGYDVTNDDFGSIDKFTGQYTVLGPLGFDARFGQGLDYDASTGEMYMAAVNDFLGEGELRRLNQPYDGSSTLVGKLGVEGVSRQFGFLGIAGGDCRNDTDCNANAVPDGCDIDDGLSEDCNFDGLPDECQDLGGDCNMNGVADGCDIAAGSSADCDGNAIPDDCDIAAGTSIDQDGNGIPDSCDPDCNLNGAADGYDILSGASNDCQPDGIPDECQIAEVTPDLIYSHNHGEHEVASLSFDDPATVTYHGQAVPLSFNFIGAGDFGPERTYEFMYVLEDGAPHNLYKMYTADGTMEIVGPANPLSGQTWCGMAWDGTRNKMFATSSASGSSASLLYTIDLETGAATLVGPMTGSPFNIAIAADCEGVLYGYDIANDDMGVIDAATGAYTSLGSLGFDANYGQGMDFDAATGELYMTAYNVDTYRSELRRFNKPYDGSSTLLGEIGEFGGTQLAFMGIATGECGPGPDCNGNEVPDECDIADGLAEDCNFDGVPDSCQYLGGDCNGNGIADLCDTASGSAADCNGNKIPDECDIASGASNDCQLDGTPDECQLGEVVTPDIQDGSFEFGTPNAVWIENSLAFGSPLCNPELCGGSGARTGIWWTWIGGVPDAVESASVEQEVTIAPQRTQLRFYLQIQSASGNGTDFLRVLVDGATVWEVFEDEPGFSDYSLVSVDISAYADGEPHTIRFEGQTSGVGVSNFFLDDVGLGPNLVPLNDCNENGVPDDCELCGDLDGDQDVDYADFVAFLNAFGRSAGENDYLPCADYDDTLTVGLGDYTVWLSCYRDFLDDPHAAPPRAPREDVSLQAPGKTATASQIGGRLTESISKQ